MVIIVMTLIQTPRYDNRLERRVFDAVRKGNINTVSALMAEHGPQRILSMEMVSVAYSNTVSALMTEHGPQRILSMEMLTFATAGGSVCAKCLFLTKLVHH